MDLPDRSSARLRLAMRGAVLAAVIALSSCTYSAPVRNYGSTGVQRIYALPAAGTYKNLGVHAWGFYRPGLGDPHMDDVWDALSEKVRALGGNACFVRHESVGGLTRRTLEVSCEVVRTN